MVPQVLHVSTLSLWGNKHFVSIAVFAIQFIFVVLKPLIIRINNNNVWQGKTFFSPKIYQLVLRKKLVGMLLKLRVLHSHQHSILLTNTYAQPIRYSYGC